MVIKPNSRGLEYCKQNLDISTYEEIFRSNAELYFLQSWDWMREECSTAVFIIWIEDLTLKILKNYLRQLKKQ